MNKPTKRVFAGAVAIGGGAPISVQSMTNTLTEDVPRTLAQIRALHEAGADLVRVSVYDMDCALAVRRLVDQSPVPLVADIHFDHELAIAAAENGIAKLRINPGNLADESKVRLVADCAKRHHISIRIGVNSGSVPKDILAKHGGATPSAMCDSAQRHIRLLEAAGYEDIVLSLKTSDVRTMVETYRMAHTRFGYPLHLGVTEAGLPGQGTIKSAIGIGALLLDGIGDTVRVSLTGSPLTEPQAAINILKALDLRGGVQLVSCPTCGRTQVDVEGIAREVERRCLHITDSVKVAVMGCVVNGPGEAKGADIAYCGGKDSGALYVRGIFVEKLTGNAVEGIMAAVDKHLKSLPQKGGTA